MAIIFLNFDKNMVDAILLISGNSSRMGKEKALLPFSENKNFISHLLETYLEIPGSNIYVLVNPQNSTEIKLSAQNFKKRVEFIVNQNPDKGRIESILLGLKQIKEGRGVFIQNIDNPFVNTELLKSMLEHYHKESFIVPQFKAKNGHPLLLGSALVQDMKTNADSISDLKNYLSSKEKRCVITKDNSILANINCMEDYQNWFSDSGLKEES